MIKEKLGDGRFLALKGMVLDVLLMIVVSLHQSWLILGVAGVFELPFYLVHFVVPIIVPGFQPHASDPLLLVLVGNLAAAWPIGYLTLYGASVVLRTPTPGMKQARRKQGTPSTNEWSRRELVTWATRHGALILAGGLLLTYGLVFMVHDV